MGRTLKRSVRGNAGEHAREVRGRRAGAHEGGDVDVQVRQDGGGRGRAAKPAERRRHGSTPREHTTRGARREC